MSRNLLYLLILLPFLSHAQPTYEKSIYQYREGYKMSLIKGDHALKPEDTARLNFYEPDSNYRVKASFEPFTSRIPFRMSTKNGGMGPSVVPYGLVYFKMNGAAITLYVFRIMAKPEFRVLARSIDKADENIVLFIPFYDNTNYKETFGGGRYLDVSAANFANGSVILDFNKACNPHGAYEKRYPYITTPLIQQDYSPIDAINHWAHPTQPNQNETTKIPANTILVSIEAGEKKFKRK